jgi:uncharacterized protein
MSKKIKEIKDKNKEKKDLKYFKFKTEIKMADEDKANGEKGIIEAYVSIFDNVDLGGDKIIKGAFAESLAKKLPKGVWMHNWDEPIAKTISAREDDKGLYIKGKLIMEVQRAKEAYALMKEGVIDEFSIGYRVLEDEWEEDGTRKLKKLRLYEWSPVLAGMNPETELIGIKSEKPEPKINYIKKEKGGAVIYFNDGRKEAFQFTYKFKKYLLSRAEEKAKREQTVEGEQAIKILRLSKKVDKINERIIKIIKTK